MRQVRERGIMKMSNKKIHYYNIDRLESYKAQINLAYSEKGNGKSYQVKHKRGLNYYFESGQRFILLRRFKDEITTEKVEHYFADVDIAGLTNNKYNCVVAWRHNIYLATYDPEKCKAIKGEIVGYYMALSQEQSYSGCSFLDVENIIFEEFMSRTIYLPGEADKLMFLYNTVDRKRGTTRLWLVGNSVSRVCPYLSDWNLLDIIKKQKHGDIDMIEIPCDDEGSVVTMAIEYCESSGRTGFAIGNAAKMINEGDWQTEPQPHLPKSVKCYRVLYRVVFLFKGFMFRADYLMDKETKEICWHVVPKDSPVKKNTIVITDKPSPSMWYSCDLYNLKLKNEKLKRLMQSFNDSNIFYCSDLCGTDFKQAVDIPIRR